jgi:peptidoglycan/LPS O-acetylase OafA/YrhL
LVRRIGRLWPLHLVTLAAIVALEWFLSWLAIEHGLSVWPSFTGEKSLDLLLSNALLLHGWVPLKLSWNAPSWSVSAELFAYLAFGLTMVTARRRALVVATCILGVSWFVSLSIASDDALYADVPALRAVCGFFAGVLVHSAFARAGRPNWSMLLGTVLEIAAVLLIVVFLVAFSRKETIPRAMPIFAATIYIFASERGVLSALLNTATFQRLGQLSYSIYLTHFVMITALAAGVRLIGQALDVDVTTPSAELFPWTLDRGVDWVLVDFGNLWLNDLAVLGVVIMVIGVSAVTHRAVELPGQQLFADLALRLRRSLRLTHFENSLIKDAWK